MGGWKKEFWRMTVGDSREDAQKREKHHVNKRQENKASKWKVKWASGVQWYRLSRLKNAYWVGEGEALGDLPKSGVMPVCSMAADLRVKKILGREVLEQQFLFHKVWCYREREKSWQ